MGAIPVRAEQRQMKRERREDSRDSVCAWCAHKARASGAAPDSAGMRWRGERVEKGARGMPVAHGGDEGRGRPRKAAGRREQPGIRGCPNGETRRAGGAASAVWRRRTRRTETSK